MPSRTTPLVNEEYYHIYNRGVALQPTFLDKKDYERFLLCISYYRFGNPTLRLSNFLNLSKDIRYKLLNDQKSKNNTIIEIISYCLMPNHFHILLKQKADGGISNFMKKVTDSFTRFFNVKHHRVGPLFQGSFKAVHIENDEQLIHLSRYIHLNPLVSFVVNDEHFQNYKWSSLRYFLEDTLSILDTKPILEHFKNKEKYLQFILDQADYGKKLERIKHITLEKYPDVRT